MATHKDQKLVAANDIYLWHNNFVPQPHEQTIFFTDRSLYRPGQTISYKGLAIRVDTEGDNYTRSPIERLQ